VLKVAMMAALTVEKKVALMAWMMAALKVD
jgi:hypothetical protein